MYHCPYVAMLQEVFVFTTHCDYWFDHWLCVNVQRKVQNVQTSHLLKPTRLHRLVDLPDRMACKLCLTDSYSLSVEESSL